MRARRWLFPAIAGVASVAFGLGVAELVSALFAAQASPVIVVGSLLIDFAPPWAKDAAIALFGTADKIALLVAIGLVLVVAAAAVGVVASRWPIVARLVIVAGGILGIAAAVTRAPWCVASPFLSRRMRNRAPALPPDVASSGGPAARP